MYVYGQVRNHYPYVFVDKNVPTVATNLLIRLLILRLMRLL